MQIIHIDVLDVEREMAEIGQIAGDQSQSIISNLENVDMKSRNDVPKSGDQFAEEAICVFDRGLKILC